MSLRIIDVSEYQGHSVDWDALAQQGVAGGLTKCTEGVGYGDSCCHRNAAAIAQAHLARGYYHFSRVDLGNTPQQEAGWFLSQLPSLDAGDQLILDLEVPTAGSGAFDAFVLAWMDIVERQTQTVPLLYTGRWYAQGLARLSHAELARYPLFDAAYGPQQPPSYAPWTRTTLWQHTDRAVYRGIGRCDESLYSGTLAQFKALGYPTAKAPPPKPPAPKRYQLDVAMHVRPAPRADAMPLGRLLPELTCVVELPVPGGGAVEQQGWAHCRTSGDVAGWLKLDNMHAIPADAVPYNP